MGVEEVTFIYSRGARIFVAFSSDSDGDGRERDVLLQYYYNQSELGEKERTTNDRMEDARGTPHGADTRGRSCLAYGLYHHVEYQYASTTGRLLRTTYSRVRSSTGTT